MVTMAQRIAELRGERGVSYTHLMETNCDAIKLEGANMAPTIRRLVEAGIPVMGHIGLTPQTASSVGGFKVQGGTPERCV